MCVTELLWLPHCPLLVGDHFVTVAVGDQMANWALCHVTSLHRGLSQSAQARLLCCRPHRHHSPILTESSFRGPEGLFRKLTKGALLQLIPHQATGLFTFCQSEWSTVESVCMCVRVCVCVDSLPCNLTAKIIFRVFMMPELADISSVRFTARLQMLLTNLARHSLASHQKYITLVTNSQEKRPVSCRNDAAAVGMLLYTSSAVNGWRMMYICELFFNVIFPWSLHWYLLDKPGQNHSYVKNKCQNWGMFIN